MRGAWFASTERSTGQETTITGSASPEGFGPPPPPPLAPVDDSVAVAVAFSLVSVEVSLSVALVAELDAEFEELDGGAVVGVCDASVDCSGLVDGVGVAESDALISDTVSEKEAEAEAEFVSESLWRRRVTG